MKQKPKRSLVILVLTIVMIVFIAYFIIDYLK